MGDRVVRGVRLAAVVCVAALAGALGVIGAQAGTGGARAAAMPARARAGATLAPTAGASTSPQQCASPQLGSKRDPHNPLELALAPGSDPLHGAHFFVDGPAHGTVAKAIEKLIGDTTVYPSTESWADFTASFAHAPLAALVSNPAVAKQVRLLEKIGSQEATNNLSEFGMGGGPGAIYAQATKVMCRNMLADPTPDTVPAFSTFFVYPHGTFCPTTKELLANQATFRRQIDELAKATGSRRAVFMMEIDSVGASWCIKGKALGLFEGDLRYEITKLSSLPHTVVYQEAGSSDEGSPSKTAGRLAQICLVKVANKWSNACARMRGFWTNSTHFNWSIREIHFGQQLTKRLDKLIFRRTHRHYHAFQVINTAQNGRGPLKRTGPGKHGVEYLCNPAGRGLGRLPTANTAPTFDGHMFGGHWPKRILDAFLWTGVPGRSHNSNCYPGAAPAGVFDLRFGLELAQNANQQLGAGFKSQPY
jgi:Glycosyl hydrolases family 6